MNISVLSNVNEILSIIDKYDNIHISFDVDSIDPQYMYSTGTVSENGIDLSEIMYLFNKILLFQSIKTINMDIVEYNPFIGTEQEQNVSLKTMKSLIDSLFS